ncbi:rhomboid-domain-containing protein [Xylariaceae sp. FL0594]|nr:rhomboid-domain-containing protein [Xylariaceae sp. FL0594]
MFRLRTIKGFCSPTRLPLRRALSSNSGYQQLPRVRLLEPALWSLGACSTIYLGCAAFDVYQDVRRAEAQGWGPSGGGETATTFEDLEGLGPRRGNPGSVWDRLASPRERQAERPEFSEPQKLTLGVMAVTAGVYLASSAAPGIRVNFAHAPAGPNNATLLTSVFGHAGLMHLAMNMYGMWWLMPSSARSPTFRENNAHLTAFYLSSGILSGLAQHATAAWPRRSYAPSLGASGALFALFGVMGVSFPHTQIGILFIPGSLPIGQMMALVALFDAVGIFVRYGSLRLGHAAHLGGLAVGVGYAKYGGREKIWRPARKVAFKSMRLLGII